MKISPTTPVIDNIKIKYKCTITPSNIKLTSLVVTSNPIPHAS